MELIWSSRVYYLSVLLHVTAAFFWLGWMVFYSFLMVPVLRRRIPSQAGKLSAHVQDRMRPLVHGLLSLLFLTGLYNLSYLGYLDVSVLFGSTRGLWMVLKLFLAILLIGTYLLAPRLSALPEEEEDPEYNDSTRRNIAVFVHQAVLTLGFFIAYLGISLGR
jgi:uncharacterized membrane protein